MKRQVGEMSSVEDKRKKAEAKVESMEEKVSGVSWLFCG